MSSTILRSPHTRKPSEVLEEGGLLTTAEVARFFRVSPWTLRDWRKTAQRRGPKYVKIERHRVRYRLADLQAYLEEETVQPGARK